MKKQKKTTRPQEGGKSVQLAVDRFEKTVRAILKRHPEKRTKGIMRAMVEEFTYLLGVFGLDLIDLKLFEEVGEPAEMVKIIKSSREMSAETSDLGLFYKNFETGDIQKLVEFYGLGGQAAAVLRDLGCKVGTDLLTLDVSGIRQKEGCGEMTARRINLLHRYLKAQHG